MIEKLKFALFVLLMAGAFTACSDDDNLSAEDQNEELTAEEQAQMAAVDRFYAANSVIRALALIDELPQNWETTQFEPQAGVAVDEANTDVRYMISDGSEHAEAYFLSIVPDEGLEGNTWTHEGVGTLTFRAVNEADCYAVIDVNLVQMPGLKQLRFVPKEIVGDNKWYGEVFYRQGDLVQDKKGVYWICVRPAGGPNHKDYAYFVSFDKSLIKTTKYEHTIYNLKADDTVDKKSKNKELSGTWYFATNLVEERIAIAAANTFALLYGAHQKEPLYSAFNAMSEELYYTHKLQLEKLLMNQKSSGGKPVANAFAIAYNSAKSNSHKKVRQEKYLQPLLVVSHRNADNMIKEYVEKTWYTPYTDSFENYGELVNSPYLHSLTTDYDPLSYRKFGKTHWNGSTHGHNKTFDVMDYIKYYHPEKGIQSPLLHDIYMKGYQNNNVLLLTQVRVKDHGKEQDNYKLVKERNYKTPDYWQFMESQMERYITDAENDKEKVEDLTE